MKQMKPKDEIRYAYPQEGIDVLEYDRDGIFVRSYDTLNDAAAAQGIKIQKLLQLIAYDDSWHGHTFDILASSDFIVETYRDRSDRERYRIAKERK